MRTHRRGVRLRLEGVRGMEPIFYTVREINGDYAGLVTDGGQVVLTGRDPAPELRDRADYLTEMRKVRHPFDRGVCARTGIER